MADLEKGTINSDINSEIKTEHNMSRHIVIMILLVTPLVLAYIYYTDICYLLYDNDTVSDKLCTNSINLSISFVLAYIIGLCFVNLIALPIALVIELSKKNFTSAVILGLILVTMYTMMITFLGYHQFCSYYTNNMNVNCEEYSFKISVICYIMNFVIVSTIGFIIYIVYSLVKILLQAFYK